MFKIRRSFNKSLENPKDDARSIDFFFFFTFLDELQSVIYNNNK